MLCTSPPQQQIKRQNVCCGFGLIILRHQNVLGRVREGLLKETTVTISTAEDAFSLSLS